MRTIKQYSYLMVIAWTLSMVFTGCGKPEQNVTAPTTTVSAPVTPKEVTPKCKASYLHVAEGWGNCTCLKINTDGTYDYSDTYSCN